MVNLFSRVEVINKFSTVFTSPGPAFQECTGSCHENVPEPKAVSSDLRSTDGLTVLARIEIVAILVHYQPSYNTSHTMKPSDLLHGGLYRWRENSLPFFLYQKLKEILTRDGKTI